MKSLRYLIVPLVMLTAVSIRAQGTASQRAIQEGFKDVQTFRDVLLPLSHKALPHKDYATLISNAQDLKKAAWTYSKMKYPTHNQAKDSTFKACRDSLSRLAIAYADAAERYDTNTVCTLLPQMEQQFEGTAAAITAYRWAEFDTLYGTVEPFYDSLLAKPSGDITRAKKKNKSAPLDLKKTVDLISNQMAAWVASRVPAEIQYRAELISEEQAYYTKLVDRMKVSAAAGDREKLRLQATDLKVRLRNFTRSYLQ